ncbi:MAG: histidine--tRNA ligase [Candidatus Aenigmarchaeota archaeon]|nr:histidine--tRNA ligase [Candidatus Aenigmarchaeota archaeon]
MTLQPPKGTRDFLPGQQKVRRTLFENMRSVLERYGYGEVVTPAIEDFEVLAKKAGQEIENEIYVFTDKGGRKIGLRFDLTVPIARIVSSDSSLPKPIKFYVIGPMWRYDNPSAGRWREFYQVSFELIGSGSAKADAEVLGVVSECLKAAGVKKFSFSVNSRGLVEELVKEAGVPEKKKTEAFRAIDKLGKIGEDGVLKEFIRYDIPAEAGKKLLKLLKKSRTNKELDELLKIAKKMGVDNIEVDNSIVRGIDYYTGFVFETFIEGKESLGSVASGGRYDTLIGLYGGQNLPAVGCGIGFDRMLECLDIPEDKQQIKVFVANVNEWVWDDGLKIVIDLRAKGIATELDLMGRDLRKQIDYAVAKGAEFLVIVGPKELKEGKIVLRNLETGKESAVKIAELGKKIA